jgi:FKBP-type peptidyl-prolyl cis-trans isomerase FkpA
MKQLNIFGLVLILFTINGACKKNSSDDCGGIAVPSVAVPAAETTALQAYLAANSITATAYGGLYYSINAGASGSGNSPAQCSRISVRYTGRLTSGSVFDQATSPVSFYLYELIVGWRLGLPLIKSGQTIKLYIPPSLGYGGQQAGNVPPNSILVFDVELVSVQ